MALTKNKSLAMIGASAVFVLMGFQNCSKVGVMDTSSGSDKVAGDGLVAGNPDGDSGSATDPNDNGGSGGTEVVTNPPAGGSGDNSGPGGGGDGDGDGNHHHGQPSTPEEIREHLVELCMKSKGGPLAGPQIDITAGKVVVESENLDRVTLGSGSLMIKGKSDKSHATHIGTTSAPIVICGMDVDMIDTGSGDVTLVNCHVKKSLTMGHGTLTTYHSSIEGKFTGTNATMVNLDED